MNREKLVARKTLHPTFTNTLMGIIKWTKKKCRTLDYTTRGRTLMNAFFYVYKVVRGDETRNAHRQNYLPNLSRLL